MCDDDVLGAGNVACADCAACHASYVPVCNCEVIGESFCNYDYGDSGSCENCADIPGGTLSGCDQWGLPDAGAADCHKWCGQQQQQQQEEEFVALDGKCAVMIGHVMNACDSDGNGAIDACEMYSCVILMEGNMREDKCPSTYDPRPLSAGTCKPCLADYQNGAESKFYPLDFYDLPLCASSANTDAQKKQLSSKAKGAVSAATLRTTFKTIHRALKKQRAQAAAK